MFQHLHDLEALKEPCLFLPLSDGSFLVFWSGHAVFSCLCLHKPNPNLTRVSKWSYCCHQDPCTLSLTRGFREVLVKAINSLRSWCRLLAFLVCCPFKPVCVGRRGSPLWHAVATTSGRVGIGCQSRISVYRHQRTAAVLDDGPIIRILK